MSKEESSRDAEWPEGTVFTVGHSTLPIERFVAVLSAYGIERLADVRTVPRSRRNPQFNADALRASLVRRASTMCRSPSSAACASRGPTRRTRAGATRASAATPTTCKPMSSTTASSGSWNWLASAAPLSCAPKPCRGAAIARSSPTLLVRGIAVVEVLSETSWREHALTEFAHVVGTRSRIRPRRNACSELQDRAARIRIRDRTSEGRVTRWREA